MRISDWSSDVCSSDLLLPPDATPDLYVGPLNHTLAGQPVSMVDPLAPDHARYPRYARAAAQALTAELEPGDALYIPTLWWHHAEATEPANILINYWHKDRKSTRLNSSP